MPRNILILLFIESLVNAYMLFILKGGQFYLYKKQHNYRIYKRGYV